MTDKNILIQNIFEHKNKDTILKTEIDYFFFIQQFQFLLFIYSMVFLSNFFFNEEQTSTIKTVGILILGMIIFIYSSRKKISDRKKTIKKIENKEFSEYISSVIRKKYKFKIMSYLTSNNDIYKIILKDINFQDICEKLIKSNNINTEDKNTIILYLLKNKEKITSSDIFYLSTWSINDNEINKKMKALTDYAKRVKLQKIKENIGEF